MSKSLQLLDFCVWVPGLPAALSSSLNEHNVCTPDASVPKLSFLPLMQRRRLSPLGRVVMASLYPLYERNRTLITERSACVFASRWGDISLTVKSLEELTAEKTLSPTAFSTSVHNAIGGLFSLFEHFHGNVTSLSGGAAGFSAALFEAYGLIQEHDSVLVSLYEDQTPNEFLAWHDAPGCPYAITLLLSSAGGTPLVPFSSTTKPAKPHNSVEDFLQFLNAEKETFTDQDGFSWKRA